MGSFPPEVPVKPFFLISLAALLLSPLARADETIDSWECHVVTVNGDYFSLQVQKADAFREAHALCLADARNGAALCDAALAAGRKDPRACDRILGD